MNKKTLIKVGIEVAVVGGIIYYMNKKKKENAAKEGKLPSTKPPVADSLNVSTKPAVDAIDTSVARQDCEKKFAHIRMAEEGRQAAINDCIAGKTI